VKNILIPISFSRASANSLQHAYSLYPSAKLSLLHCYPAQSYSRRYDFGRKDYNTGIKEKLGAFYKQHLEQAGGKPIIISQAGAVSDVVSQISGRFDLMIMTRKTHPRRRNGYFSEKQLFIIARAACPVLIMPVTDRSFTLGDCEHIWHIQRRNNEEEIVNHGMHGLGIQPGRIVTKSFTQQSFLSAFWKNLTTYESTHDRKLLAAIDKAHESEPIDLIVLVDHDQSVFINFLKSDTIRIFCKYEIPLLVFPAGTVLS
jgi:nucleotide-binding universal stress UspA family protein